MTIEVDGFVKSLTYVKFDKVEVVLHLEADRTAAPHEYMFAASPQELELYKAGTPVKVLIRPNVPSVGKSEQ